MVKENCTQNLEKLLINQYKESMKICPRCGSKKSWSLSTGQIRCSKCGLTIKASKNLWSKTRISPQQKGRLVDYFSLGIPAYRLRFRIPYSKPTILRWFRTLREVIYSDCIKELKPLSGEIEMDETMTGVRRPGKRGWGATGKNIVFGIYPDAVKSLLFQSHHVLRRLCSLILPNILKLEVYTTQMTGLPMPFYL